MVGDTTIKPASRTAHVGFTLIEILIVLAIVALLLTVALPRYLRGLDIAKDAVVTENLRLVRSAIDAFYADTNRYPESLVELVDKRYLRALPYDPIVESDSKWVIVPPTGGAKGNVYDIRSAASGTAHNGKPYSEL